MKRNFRIPVRTGLVFVLLLLGAAPNLYAIDSHNRYFAYGLGERSCQDYINFRDRKLETLEQQHPRFTKDELYDIVNRVVEQWIAGFLTAHNLYVSDTYNVAGKLTMDDVKNRLETSCRSNPKEHFAQAMVTVVQELNPQRVHDESEK